MLYPRMTSDNILIADNQMIGYREHMTNKQRTLFLTGVITGETESHNLLLALDTMNHDPIKIMITSPGGDLDSTFLLYDTIRLIKSPVWTIGRYCASAAALLLACGVKGKRYLYPHASTMLHLPSGHMEGDTRDWEIQHEEMKKCKNKMLDVLIECGVTKPKKDILADMDREYWMTPEMTIEYGLADKILDKKTMGGWYK